MPLVSEWGEVPGTGVVRGRHHLLSQKNCILTELGVLLVTGGPSALGFDLLCILQDQLKSRGREGRPLKGIVAPMSVTTLLEDPRARLENGDATGKPSHYKNQP